MVDGPVPELAGLMTRHAMRQNDLDPDDPAHVAQHERDLDLARGRRAVVELARHGVELGTPDEEELVDLGRAYAPVELREILARIVEERSPTRHRPERGWSCSCPKCYQRREDWHSSHPQKHAANETCPYDPPDLPPDPAQDQDQTPRMETDKDGARAYTTITPDILGSGKQTAMAPGSLAT
jgi:hypothetical protein